LFEIVQRIEDQSNKVQELAQSSGRSTAPGRPMCMTCTVEEGAGRSTDT